MIVKLSKAGEIFAPVYSEEINLKVPDVVSINLLLSERMLFYPLP